MAKLVRNPPSAYLLMNSMRSIGYSFNSAVADIIDNSISAFANNIWIYVNSDPTSLYLAFIDDGKGMSEEELVKAMKYGSFDSAEQREENDLGRFGLGLKSASLSQCKKLTVVSKQGGALCAAVWDLDLIKDNGDWSLEILSEDEIASLPCIEKLSTLSQGTIVIWENFDSISNIYSGATYKGLTDNVDNLFDYLGLIFHRFLSDKLNIFINDTPIEPADPFLESNRKTEVGRTYDLTMNDENGVERHIEVTAFLLPFLKDINDDQKKKLGGVSRINAEQGFYVYRNRRLIIYGTWFRMSYRSELLKYARIKVDIPSSLDSIWHIDVKKQTAELPPSIKQQLHSCVEKATFSSRRKNDHRLTLSNSSMSSIWQKTTDRNKKVIYKINRDSDLIRRTIQTFEPSDLPKIDLLINAIEKSIPYHDMYTDEANDNISEQISDIDREDIIRSVIQYINIYQQTSGKDFLSAADDVVSQIPWNKYEWLKEAILKEHKNG